ncbi:chemotaxis protein [Paenibacillus sp. SI8]|uniref:chemotaxis protein n=1 Tax=unclassified Paenibacillus TaxID=185978 RepID=UPI0034666399
MNIAVAIIHGMGQQGPNFHEDMKRELVERIAALNPDINLIVKGVFWADITDHLEKKLWHHTHADQLHWDKFPGLRQFVVHYFGDAIAYQAIPPENGPCQDDYIYDDIHLRYATCLQSLAEDAGENAPLCIIAHSLGTIISSNFFYDLQHGKLSAKTAALINNCHSRLVRGETLTHFYTMGSPIALWTLRFRDFGIPISVPAPGLQQLGIGEWANFYDKDDLIAYPIKNLNPHYHQVVTEDMEVKCPGMLGWTPVSHTTYFEADEVLSRIVQSLNHLSQQITMLPEVAASDE